MMKTIKFSDTESNHTRSVDLIPFPQPQGLKQQSDTSMKRKLPSVCNYLTRPDVSLCTADRFYSNRSVAKKKQVSEFNTGTNHADYTKIIPGNQWDKLYAEF